MSIRAIMTGPPKRSPFAVPTLLGLLATEPRHGYALFTAIQRDLADVWSVGMNRVYALLDEMEQEGLIKGRVEQAGNRPERRVFHATARGRRRFAAWLRQPSPTMREMRTDFPPKLYFALQRGSQDVAQLVQVQRDACHAELERMAAQLRGAGDAQAYRALIYDFRVRQIDAVLAWLDACEAQAIAAPAAGPVRRSAKSDRAQESRTPAPHVEASVHPRDSGRGIGCMCRPAASHSAASRGGHAG